MVAHACVEILTRRKRTPVPHAEPQTPNSEGDSPRRRRERKGQNGFDFGVGLMVPFNEIFGPGALRWFRKSFEEPAQPGSADTSPD